ncbi:MAG TPA: hypothetical protein VN904_04630 [Chthoniobacterales bacterium]|jgi:hypothetical protein|nr:hypothetical protein [Chthoniobacterales bacterium]
MKKITTLVSMSILIAFGAMGAGKPADKAAEPGKIETKNKSSFAMDVEARNPFWPIGWKPTAKLSSGGAGADQGGDIPVSAFVVSTITLDQGTHFAIINGKAMQEGQQFGLQLGTQMYQVLLKKIEDGRVILSRHDQEIVVPLRRK